TEKGCWPAGGAACAACAARASRRATASGTVLIETFLHEVLRDAASALFYRGRRAKSIAGWRDPVGLLERLDGDHPGLEPRSVPEVDLVSRRSPLGTQRWAGRPDDGGPRALLQGVEDRSLVERHVNVVHEDLGHVPREEPSELALFRHAAAAEPHHR